MSRILQIAWREFLATVMTKAFLIGLLAAPVTIVTMTLLMPLLIDNSAPKVIGEIAVLDRSNAVAERLRAQLTPEAFVERRRTAQQRLQSAMPEAMRGLADAPAARDTIDKGLDQALGEAPQLRVTVLSGDTDLESAKRSLLDGKRLALVVIHADAVVSTRPAGKTQELGSLDLFVRPKLDELLLVELRDALRTSLVDARLAARDLDAEEIRALTRTPPIVAIQVDASGERRSNDALRRMLPMAFMALILVAVMTAGQQLMTSTIEEKSSRVVEVLLSAVSPAELMAGKILGQLAVSTLMFGLYGAAGLVALASFAALGLIDAWLLFYGPLFFLIAFVVVASLMAAIGAAVNELREAQSLLMPVILIVMVPMLLWLPISRDPNSTMAVVLSLTPPVNPFVMILRMASSSPPPLWQVWLSIAIGIASMFAAIWFAGRVFRIGLLMHGKPPNLLTLLRWVRQS